MKTTILLTGAILAMLLLGVAGAQTTGDKLTTTKFKAYVNGDKDSGTIDVKPEDKLEIQFEVENTFPKTGGLDIEDIEITALIKGIDDGEDLDPDDEPDEFDLEPQENDEVNIEWEIPLEVDDRSFDLTIEVKGTDTNGTLHIVNLDKTVKVDKETHDLLLRRAELLTGTLKCSRNTQMDVNIVNIGTSKEDMVLRVANEELGVAYQDSKELDDDPFDSDSKYSTSVPISVSKDAEAGTYVINLRATFDKGGRFVEKNLDLVVEDCVAKEPEQTPAESVVVVQQPVQQQPPAATGNVVVAEPDETAETGLFSTSNAMTFVIGLEVIVLVIGLALVAVWARKRRS